MDVLLEGRHGLRVGGHPESGTALVEAQDDPAGQGLQLFLRKLQLVRDVTTNFVRYRLSVGANAKCVRGHMLRIHPGILAHGAS